MPKRKSNDDEMTYAKSGVDIDKADKAIDRVKKLINTTYTSEVPVGIGGFAGLYKPDMSLMTNPILVSSTDGVGTKLLLAHQMKKYDTVGIDLVAMVVNDIICLGARPMFLLDYVGIGKFNDDVFEDIIKGIVMGCKEAGCALIGGETAELPNMYPPGEFDLAAFGVGVIDEKDVIDGSGVREGDVVVGLPSSGFHSNGYSLVRKVLSEKASFDLTDRIPGLSSNLGETLLTPTTIYVKPILDIIVEGIEIQGIANITGGGIVGNIPRILPSGVSARIDPSSWIIPKEIKLIVEWGKIPYKECYRVFNMGIGMVLIMRGGEVENAMSIISRYGIEPVIIGEIVPGFGEVIMTNQR